MGGIGSGRQRNWFAEGSTDDYLTIDVRRAGIGRACSPRINPSSGSGHARARC